MIFKKKAPLNFPVIVVAFLVLAPARGFSKPKMVTTTTDLAWMAQQIAGPDAEVESLLNGTEDPHFVDARPDYIRKVSSADAVCIVGLDLEVGWMPKVLSKSGREHLQPGGKGFCETGSRIEVLEKPSGLIDRSMGDVHPSGNPHFWLSPTAFGDASDEVLDTFARIDPSKAESYKLRAQEFKLKMKELESAGKEKLKNAGVVAERAQFLEYHREFAYFAKAFGLTSLGSVEEKPGISPSAGRIKSSALLAKSNKIAFVLATKHAPQRTLMRFEELSGSKVLSVAVSVSKHGEPRDYYALLSSIQDAVVFAVTGEVRK
jgi:zinc/manganese transport system substrate-binding protein